MRFHIESLQLAIDALAVFDGFQRVPGRKWVYIPPSDYGDYLFTMGELPGYFEDLNAAFKLEKRIYKGPLWYHYTRLLHLLCKSEGDASVHASAKQRATAFYIATSIKSLLRDWPGIVDVESVEPKPTPDDLSILVGLLKFHGMAEDEAYTAISRMTEIRTEYRPGRSGFAIDGEELSRE